MYPFLITFVELYLIPVLDLNSPLVVSRCCRYNNRTYKIDDIAWDHTPTNTFKRGDEDISFKKYFKDVGVIVPV